MKGSGHDEMGWLLAHLRGQWELVDNPHEDPPSFGFVSRLRGLQKQWGNVAVGRRGGRRLQGGPADAARDRQGPARGRGDRGRRQVHASAARGRGVELGRLLVPIDVEWAPGVIKRFQAFTGNDDPEDDEVDAASHGWNTMHLPTSSSPAARFVT
jgi:hypothetical protein